MSANTRITTPAHADGPVPVLYLDNHLLVVVKPAGMLAQADHTGDLDVLTWGKAYLKDHFNKPGNVFLGLVHRLDRPASGVMALARTSKAAARLTAQFKARTPQKTYLAILEGVLQGAGTWIDHIAKLDRHPRVVSAQHPGARRASLAYTAVETVGRRTLVRVALHTGRPHQIRLQFARRGYPLLGDFRHGAKQELDGRNLALHALSLSLLHPTQKVPMRWSALPPATWPSAFEPAISALVKASL